jgi:hypothetical protein
LTYLQCFADDMTVLMEETINNQVRLKGIFNEYKELSGLEINEDKGNKNKLG